jgi:hypothetical protein
MTKSEEYSGLRTHEVYKSWLKFTAFIVGSFGPVFFLAAAGFERPTQLTLDIISWPLNGEPLLTESALVLSAVSGGFLVGWGLMIYFLSIWIYDKAPDLVRKTVLISLLGWYVLDSSGSILSGNEWNALFNSILLLLAIGPMWVPARK